MKVTILSGIPCSGKTTWAQEQNDVMISRDIIREYLFGKNYKQNRKDEDFITKRFHQQANVWLGAGYNIIMDNTHCKEKYLDQLVEQYKEHRIKIKYFDVPLYKACYRNILRYIRTGKWIPFKVMKAMNRNYNRINREKYEQYISM